MPAATTGSVRTGADGEGPVPGEQQFASAAAIGNRAARGGMILVLRSGLLQSLQVVSSITLARAISPGEYGALAVTFALVGMARSVGDLGLIESLVVRKDFEERDLRTASTVVIVVAVSAAALVGLAGVAVDRGLLSGSGPPALTAAYAGTIVIDALRLGPVVRLMRALKFKQVAVASTVEAVVTSVVTIGLLLAGFGVWAVVIGQYACSTAGVLTYRRLGGSLALPKRGGRPRYLVTAALPFQGPIILGGAVGAILPLIVAAYLNARGLGLWAWSTILATPLAAALITVQSVLVPSLARLYGQYEERFSQAADRLARLIAVAAGAAAGGIIGLAPVIIRKIFSPKWADATGAVQVTLVGVLPLAMSFLVSAAMQARGRSVPRLRCAAIAALFTLVAVYPLMLEAGVTGAAVASAVVGPTVDMILLARIAAIPLRRAAFDGILAGAAMGSASFFLGPHVTTAPELVAAGLTIALAGLVVMWLIDGEVLAYAWSLVASGRSASGVSADRATRLSAAPYASAVADYIARVCGPETHAGVLEGTMARIAELPAQPTAQPARQTVSALVREAALGEAGRSARRVSVRMGHARRGRFGHAKVPELLRLRQAGGISHQELDWLYTTLRKCRDCRQLATSLDAAERDLTWALKELSEVPRGETDMAVADSPVASKQLAAAKSIPASAEGSSEPRPAADDSPARARVAWRRSRPWSDPVLVALAVVVGAGCTAVAIDRFDSSGGQHHRAPPARAVTRHRPSPHRISRSTHARPSPGQPLILG